MRSARTPDELGLDQYDRQRLAHALARATDLRFFRRVQAVLLLARGFSIPEAARVTAAKPNAVYRWLRVYLRTRRPGDLADAPGRGGRVPPTASPTPASSGSSAGTRWAWGTTPPAGRWPSWPATWAARTAARSRPAPCAAGCATWACAGSGRGTSTPTRTRTGPR